ncbi:hypothetical protein GCM10010393_28920 [Streptomyces gobitricini]|uniref:Transposase n=1 Tax=Streptomyces gobitricini TaxID=68211 RepID=A0ABP5ZDJ1_9ACTN
MQYGRPPEERANATRLISTFRSTWKAEFYVTASDHCAIGEQRRRYVSRRGAPRTRAGGEGPARLP